MLSGIVNSDHRHFGGEDCYQEIPFLYHLVVCSLASLIAIFAMVKWFSYSVDKTNNRPYLAPNLLEKIVFWLGLLNLVYTCYRKIVRKEGVFILNPCHITFLMLLILLVADNTSSKMKWLHTAWTGWLFGGFAALVIPHLEDLSLLEAITFFAEHLLIWPFGPLLLHRRYEYMKPTLLNHATAYGNILLYHMAFLAPFCRLTKSNINFMICHSPAEPFFDGFGYHYFSL